MPKRATAGRQSPLEIAKEGNTLAKIIDLKNKMPGRGENTVEKEGVAPIQTKTSLRPEVLMAQSIHPAPQEAPNINQRRNTVLGLRSDRFEDKPIKPWSGVHRRTTDTDEIVWIGPLSTHQPNVRNITITAAIFFVLAVLIQIFDGNLITTIFFALLGAVILTHAGKEPKTGNIEINPVAVIIDNKPHRYNDIRSFWIEYDLGLGIKELSLQLKRWHAPYIKIPLIDQNPVQIRMYLLQFLPEEEHRDTLADVLARKLGL